MTTLIDLRRQYFGAGDTVPDAMQEFFGDNGTLADAETAYYVTLYPSMEGATLTELRRHHYLTNTTGTSDSNTTAELEVAFYEQELA